MRDKPSEPAKVLAVDDSKTMRNFLCACLEGRFETRAASDGLEALEVFDAFKPDALVLDLDMPRMDGLEVIRRIRGRKKGRDTYIIVLSGHQERDLKTKALDLGANDYLTKPCHPEELLARVNVAARQTALTRELRRAYAVIREEILLVSDLQTRLLPRESPLVPGASVRSLYRPSGEASGDYYDYFFLKDGTLRLIMADVSGKGARAAFVMGVVQSYFRSAGAAGRSLSGTLGMLNERLLQVFEDSPDFLTIFAGDYDPETRRLHYVNAGHCPGLILPVSGSFGEAEELPALNPPAGFFEQEFAAKSVVLEPGARLFLYTDGFYEWERPDGEISGIDAFIEASLEYFSKGDGGLEGLYAAIRDQAGGDEAFRDDLTAMLLRVEPAAP